MVGMAVPFSSALKLALITGRNTVLSEEIAPALIQAQSVFPELLQSQEIGEPSMAQPAQ